MNVFELLVLGLALSADSCAAAVSIGIDLKRIKLKNALLIASIFSIFQSMMPVIGYTLTNILSGILASIDHFISFLVLFILGVKMIKDRDNEEQLNYMNIYALIIISIAVTIDAFTVGITYSLLHISLPLTIIINFLTTFITTLIGLKVGNILGSTFKKHAKTMGGLVLISLGIKILLHHINI
ncbi:MAG: manganese efflux pump MntP family protein [Bacilli bacterium]|nr:manganese efflux pump MntP family protein [Bacilli bacterium]